jgi:hypothetical protein
MNSAARFTPFFIISDVRLPRKSFIPAVCESSMPTVTFSRTVLCVFTPGNPPPWTKNRAPVKAFDLHAVSVQAAPRGFTMLLGYLFECGFADQFAAA